MNRQPPAREPGTTLQSLVETHLRDSLTLLAVMKAEQESLQRIVQALEGIPSQEHARLVGMCIQRVAGKFIVDR